MGGRSGGQAAHGVMSPSTGPMPSAPGPTPNLTILGASFRPLADVLGAWSDDSSFFSSGQESEGRESESGDEQPRSTGAVQGAWVMMMSLRSEGVCKARQREWDEKAMDDGRQSRVGTEGCKADDKFPCAGIPGGPDEPMPGSVTAAAPAPSYTTSWLAAAPEEHASATAVNPHALLAGAAILVHPRQPMRSTACMLALLQQSLSSGHRQVAPAVTYPAAPLGAQGISPAGPAEAASRFAAGASAAAALRAIGQEGHAGMQLSAAGSCSMRAISVALRSPGPAAPQSDGLYGESSCQGTHRSCHQGSQQPCMCMRMSLHVAC